MFDIDAWKVYVYAFAVLAVLGAASLGGYKVGEWKQATADSKVVQAAQDALAKNSKDVAEAEKSARAQADQLYKDEIKELKYREKFSSDLAAQLQKDNAALTTKLFNANKAVEAAKHDPDAKKFLSTPIPAALRDGLLDALKPASRDSMPSGAGDRPDGGGDRAKLPDARLQRPGGAGGGLGRWGQPGGRLAARSRCLGLLCGPGRGAVVVGRPASKASASRWGAA